MRSLDESCERERQNALRDAQELQEQRERRSRVRQQLQLDEIEEQNKKILEGQERLLRRQ
jgi:hypothetical protein